METSQNADSLWRGVEGASHQPQRETTYWEVSALSTVLKHALQNPTHQSIVISPSTHVFPRDWSKGQRQTNPQGVSFPFLDNDQETSEMFLSGKINSLEPDVLSGLRIPPTF